MSRRGFVGGAGLACTLALLALSGCSPGSPQSRERVVYCLEGAPDVYSVGVYLARDRGYLGSDGPEVELVEPDEGCSTLDMVNAGKAQFGLSSQEALAGVFAIDEPASVIAVAAVSQHDITDEVAPSLPRTAAYAKRDPYSTVIVANDAYLVGDPDGARSFLDALGRGYGYASRHPKAAARALCEAAAGSLGEKRVARSMALLAPELEDAKGRWGTISQKRWDAFFSWLRESGRIDREIPKHHGYTLDYLRTSNQEKPGGRS